MPKTYEPAPEDLMSLLTHARERWHPVLTACGVTIAGLLEADIDKDTGIVCPSLMANGYPAAATIAVTKLKDRVLGIPDALLVVDACWWGRHLGEDERLALLDHELTHLEVCADPGGKVLWDAETRELVGRAKDDDIGRPKLRLRKYDFMIGGFVEVARRHKTQAVEVQQVMLLQNDVGQWAWEWDFRPDPALAAE